MESVAETIKGLSLEKRELLERMSKMSRRERIERSTAYANEEPGDLDKLDGYNCKACLNRGFIWDFEERAPMIEGGEPIYSEITRECSCIKVRANIRRMKQSGLESIIKKSTFDHYQAVEDWQKAIKKGAQDFAAGVDTLENKWLFMGGGVGSGKTHLCTAIAREFLYAGKEVRYMLWVSLARDLKAVVNDAQKYADIIEPLKNAEVLYIDDLFKPTKDNSGQDVKPTAGDIRLAYEIINHRYQRPDSITIISSEWYIAELEEIDSAVGSRIYEMTKQNAYNIAREPGRNYRIKDMNIL